MSGNFVEALEDNNREMLLSFPKSDLHSHSSRGCRRAWLEEKLGRELRKAPELFDGLAGMQEWFTSEVKPYCKGAEGVLIRWEGAFAEAKRNHIKRLSMSFGIPDIELAGGPEEFRTLIDGFHRQYCPDTLLEPEITYDSFCNVESEADIIDRYISSGFFRSLDICGSENVRPFEEFLPLYRKAERYHLTKRMHVGETGSAENVQKAVEILGLSEVHHGIHACESEGVMRFLADNQIQLNICPSSNVMLGYVRDYRHHPIRTLVENGVSVTINTDDLLLFDSSIENEYLKLYGAGTLSAKQLDDIRARGLCK